MFVRRCEMDRREDFCRTQGVRRGYKGCQECFCSSQHKFCWVRELVRFCTGRYWGCTEEIQLNILFFETATESSVGLAMYQTIQKKF